MYLFNLLVNPYTLKMTDTAKSKRELVVVTEVKPPDATLLESWTSTEVNSLKRIIPPHCKFKTPVLLRKRETTNLNLPYRENETCSIINELNYTSAITNLMT